MLRKKSQWCVRLAISAGALVGLAVFTGSAAAACVPSTTVACETVAGTTVGTLSLAVSTAATFGVSLAPGTSPQATGALLVTDTGTTWTLQAQDTNAGAGAGHMVALGGPLCSGSDAALANPLGLGVSGASGTPSSINMSGSPQTVETGAGPLAAALLTSTYTQVIPTTEAMTAGCVYNLTTTYTLQ